MMKKNFAIAAILHILINTAHIYSQKHDYNWITGYPPLDLGQHYGGTKTDFNHTPPDVSTFDIKTELGAFATMTMSDKDGNLEFYSNGCKIMNAQHEEIENGGNLNSPGWAFEDVCKANFSYYGVQGMITLPIPDKEREYIVFHLRYDDNTPDDYLPASLLYTTVDMKANQGKGKVLKKNEILLKKTFRDMMSSVRHGNGRDWWLVNPLYESDTIVLHLLTPYGIEGPFYAKTEMEWGPESFEKYVGSGVFSPDGNKYAQMVETGVVNIFDFDRCTGRFSCPKKCYASKEAILADGLAFSPNNRFLYCTTVYEALQFDVTEKDIDSSKVVVGEYDGFKAPLYTTIFQPHLAPNGKIYITCSVGTYVLHTIHDPDKKGTDCHFVNHDFYLPTNYGFCLPTYPNYRLYDWQGSPCDSLGVNAPDSTKTTVFFDDRPVLTPNPASTSTIITLPHCTQGTLSVYDSAGRQVYEQKDVRSGIAYILDVQPFPVGMYMVVLRSGGKSVVASRLVVAR